MIAREHIGHGWGDPLDPSQPEVWLCNGYVCAYDPERPGVVELFTEFGRTDSGFARTNTAASNIAYAEVKARGDGSWLRQWLDCDRIGSRFD